MLNIADFVHESALNFEHIGTLPHIDGFGHHAGKCMASIHVPNIFINFCALGRTKILNRVDTIDRGLLPFENNLYFLREGMAYWFMLNLAMVTAELKCGHSNGQISVLLATFTLEMQGTTIMTCIIHGPK